MKRAGSPRREDVILMDGYERVVHSNEECPQLKAARGTPKKCKVRDGRLIDENGNYQKRSRDALRPLQLRSIVSVYRAS